MMGMADMKWEICFVGILMAIFAAPTCHGFTDPRDVMAINSLYVSLGYPPLPGWLLVGGDPCGEGWQGVQCVNSNITGIVLNGANLGGVLGENLGDFSSIIQIDLSNNHIGGSIPSNLPITIKSFFLSGNQLTGSIPESLSTLGQLSDLSLNSNHLTGAIPDSFQQLTGLANMDLSDNNLNGQLPPSMGNLSSIATLHLQDNQLTGTLDILQDLPLIDLDVENNLFWGPIPPKLLIIPNFRSTGNPFNTTVIPSPPALSPAPSSFVVLPPEIGPGMQVIGPSPPKLPNSASGEKFLTTKKVMWIALSGFLVLVVAVGCCLCITRWCKKRPVTKFTNEHNIDTHVNRKKNSQHTTSSLKPRDHGENVSRQDDRSDNLAFRSKKKQGTDVKAETVRMHRVDHLIDMTGVGRNSVAPPSQPPQLVPAQRVIVKPVVPPSTTKADAMKTINSAKPFTIASLQQYTNSFSQENLIGGGTIGTVYRADLPNGKLLSVKKVDNAVSRQWSDEDFIKLVTSISKLQHNNIVELVGYCVEHGQRLLVHKYCTNGTLHEALHIDDEIHEKLSWNARIHLALQAARALEYLHEVCQPPIVHRNFNSANVLLDDELVVRVSDCGLAALIPSKNIAQLQGSGYGAPELESGSYTYQSDIYSFGVVMLELLTGRKAYDRTRPRGEQFLVRWAIPQLHDIDALSRMVDPSLNSAYSSKSLSRFADIISLCLQPEPEFRPPMSEIVQNLLHMIQRGS